MSHTEQPSARQKQSYHGAFFWLAAISFVMPLFVAARAFQAVPVTTKPASRPDASGVDHRLWDYLLKTYVENGLVDYQGMQRDYLFRVYLRQLADAQPQHLKTYDERLALLCNAYNALVINGVIVHDIENSVMDFQQEGKGFFDVEEHILAGRTLSLNYLEHEIIRKLYREPRVHVALVCAARSCPAIRPEAYVGARLNAQLEDQSRLFANNPRYVSFDQTQRRVVLSPILKWYGEDWDAVGGYLPWLAERVETPTMREALRKAGEGDLEVAFADYDWTLNTQSRALSRPAAAGRPSFGSGSIPNR